MKLIITDAASQWFRDEMGLEPGNGVKFYGKTYGQTGSPSWLFARIYS